MDRIVGANLMDDYIEMKNREMDVWKEIEIRTSEYRRGFMEGWKAAVEKMSFKLAPGLTIADVTTRGFSPETGVELRRE